MEDFASKPAPQGFVVAKSSVVIVCIYYPTNVNNQRG